MLPKTSPNAAQLPRHTTTIKICEWLMPFIAALMLIVCLWSTVQMSSFTLDFVFNNTALDTNALAWSTALLVVILSGVYIQNFFEKRMDLTPWFYVKRSFTLAIGFGVGTLLILSIDLIGSFCYGVYFIVSFVADWL